jgi:hypothetical protein
MVYKKFSTKELPLAPCRPSLVHVPCYSHTTYPLFLSKVVCEYIQIYSLALLSCLFTWPDCEEEYYEEEEYDAEDAN